MIMRIQYHQTLPLIPLFIAARGVSSSSIERRFSDVVAVSSPSSSRTARGTCSSEMVSSVSVPISLNEVTIAASSASSSATSL